MNISGVNTAISEIEIVRMVKLISPEPARAASNGASPSSMRFQITSTMTIASSTTKPTAMVSAISDRLSRLKLQRQHHRHGRQQRQRDHGAGDQGGADIAQEQEDHGHHQGDGDQQGDLHVIDRGAMVWVRSARTWISMAGGILACRPGSALVIWFTVWMTLAPGFLKMISRMLWPPFRVGIGVGLAGKAQAPIWLFSTPGWPRR